LTLAQRLGIYDKPPGPLSAIEWKDIEKSVESRKIDCCSICLEKFRIEEQLILSCGHVFHKICLSSFEKYSKVKACPLCRLESYDKKPYLEGQK